MKLERFIIQNFRGLKGDENIIEFKNSNIIFLIGQNNVGKSTYLRGYEFFVNPKQEAVREDFYNYDTKIPIIMEGWFSIDAGDDSDGDLVGNGKTKEPNWVQKWVNVSSGLIKVRKIWNNVGKFEKQTYSPQQNEWVLNGFGGMDSLFTKYAPKPIAINAMEDQITLEEKVNKLVQDICIKRMKDSHPALCENVIDSIKKLQDAMLQSDDINKLNEGMNEHFLICH